MPSFSRSLRYDSTVYHTEITDTTFTGSTEDSMITGKHREEMARVKTENTFLRERCDRLQEEAIRLTGEVEKERAKTQGERERGERALDALLELEGKPAIHRVPPTTKLEDLDTLFEEDADEVQKFYAGVREHGVTGTLPVEE